MQMKREAPVRAEWLTYKQAQDHANIGRTKLTELLNAGKVKAARVGRAVRISRQSLDSYLEQNSYQNRS